MYILWSLVAFLLCFTACNLVGMVLVILFKRLERKGKIAKADCAVGNVLVLLVLAYGTVVGIVSCVIIAQSGVSIYGGISDALPWGAAGVLLVMGMLIFDWKGFRREISFFVPLNHLRILQILLQSGSAGMYGLDIVKASNGRLKEGLIYLYLDRLERDGDIASRKEDVHVRVGQIPRRLYTLTEQGRRRILKEIAERQSLNSVSH